MKGLIKVLVALLVVVVAVFAGVLFYVDTIAKKAIEYGGSQALGVPTSLQQIHISLFGGEASLTGLKVANPPGFSGDQFLSLGSGEVAVSLGSLTGDTIRIPKVRLADIVVNLEQDGKKNNIQPLLRNAKAASGGASSGRKAPAASEGSGKKFIVDRFTIENVRVTAHLAALGQSSKINLVLPKIELKNLGADKGGMPMEEMIQKVVQAILDAAANSSGSLSPMLSNLLKGELKGLDTIRTEVIGKAGVEVEKAAAKVQEQLDKVQLPAGDSDKVQQEADKVLKGVKGLFGGSK
ncbi:hypothetical protein [Geothermobacter hydrogeniphilus]|uniref:AsmA family protein n=1 Tax=Geothermobacter hydrogeniphilus TaxID=1969733 RepID=A0A1X0XXB9_9BACT|nr:hypothetical protein [Geothermobacter hydrogeniphilus]ORJ57550.1 hypothetical protein B5V00_13100 [Geothermobacter hydrogeniphilus]